MVRGRESNLGLSILIVYGSDLSADEAAATGIRSVRGRECIVGLSILLVYGSDLSADEAAATGIRSVHAGITAHRGLKKKNKVLVGLK